MRIPTLTRAGALLTAALLPLTLGTAPVSATPETHSAASAPAGSDLQRNGRLATGADLRNAGATTAKGTSSAAYAPDIADVTMLKGYSTQLSDPTDNYIDVDIAIANNADLQYVDLDLSVGNVAKGSFPLYYDEDLEVFYIAIPRTIGLGAAKFTGSTLTYEDGATPAQTVDTTQSNTFYIRRYITAKNPAVTYTYTSTKKAFYPKGIKIFVPSTGNYTSLGKIALQYKSSPGGAWKTKKTITLNSSGNGSFAFTTSSKYFYRLYSPETATSGGMRTFTTKKL